MIAIFKNNLFANTLLLLPYTFVVRLSTFVNPSQYVPSDKDTILTHWFYDLVSGPIVQAIVAALLIFLQAVAINRLCVKNRIGSQITLLSGLCYILLTSFMPAFLPLSPSLLANTFLLWALLELYEVYKKPFTSVNLFNMGFAIGCAALLVPSVHIYLFFGLIGTMILKSFSIAQILQSTIGFVGSIYIFYSLIYLGDAPLTGELGKYSLSLNISLVSKFKDYLAIFTFLAFFITIAVLGYNGYMVKKSMQVQKKIDLLYWALIYSLFSAAIAQGFQVHLAILAFVPLSILLHMTLTNIKNSMIQELVHLGALALLFLLHFGVI